MEPDVDVALLVGGDFPDLETQLDGELGKSMNSSRGASGFGDCALLAADAMDEIDLGAVMMAAVMVHCVEL